MDSVRTQDAYHDFDGLPWGAAKHTTFGEVLHIVGMGRGRSYP
jgi:hypothetical protein